MNMIPPSKYYSSKLASLFGLGKSSQDGNTTLTYTAPKQPKRGHNVESQNVKGQTAGQSSGQVAPSTAKLSIITAKAVQTYKL
jgi:hypothetical protein